MSRRAVAVSGVLVVVALIVGLVVAPGGPSGLLLVSHGDSNISLLVPSGWRDEDLAGPHGTELSGWVDGSNRHASEVVQATDPVHGTPQARATALVAQLRHTAGFAQSYLGPVQLYGGRKAYELEYLIGRYPYAVFEFDACSSTIAMTVTLSASSGGKLGDEELTLAEYAEPICDGPAFTSPDRADLALPLALPS